MRTFTTVVSHVSLGFSALCWPLVYFATIVFSNFLMIWLPTIPLFGTVIPPAIFAFGFVFVLRDFAQQAIGHYVLLVMSIAAVATYALAGPTIAFASVGAFVVSELADWGIYTMTKRPMRERILLSSLVGVPVDTAAFFLALGILDPHSLVVGIGVKLIGTGLFWIIATICQRKEV